MEEKDAPNNFKQTFPKEMMPREQLIKNGARGVSTANLIAILLRTGIHGQPVVDLAESILRKYDGSLMKIANTSVEDLQKTVKGLGVAKSVELLAALELGRRIQIEDVKERVIRNSNDLYEVFRSHIEVLDNEEFWLCLMDNSNNVLSTEQISEGGWTSTGVDVRVIMNRVLTRKATSFGVAHNHPSGNKKPSEQDRALTKKIATAARTLDLTFVDHIIVARGKGYFSFADNGLM